MYGIAFLNSAVPVIYFGIPNMDPVAAKNILQILLDILFIIHTCMREKIIYLK